MLGKEFRRHALGGRLEGQSLRPVFAKDQGISVSRGRVRPGATRALKAAGLVHIIERHGPFEQNLLLQKDGASCLCCSPPTAGLVIRLDSRLAAHSPFVSLFWIRFRLNGSISEVSTSVTRGRFSLLVEATLP